jgi:hypothetical protein
MASQDADRAITEECDNGEEAVANKQATIRINRIDLSQPDEMIWR